VRNAAPFRSAHPSPISCGLNLLDIQETAKYTSRRKKEVLINNNAAFIDASVVNAALDASVSVPTPDFSDGIDNAL